MVGGLGARRSGFGIRRNEKVVVIYLSRDHLRLGAPELRPVGETLKEEGVPRIAQGLGNA